MDKIVSDLQAYSRPVVPIPRQKNIPTLVREVLSSIRLGEEIEVKTNFDPILETVVADPDMLKKVLFNLTINAVQAMPSGGTLTISTLKCDDLMVLEVKDTGVGISKENMKKLFTPFFTTKAKGQGMGLTVCKRLVEAHDGTISVESEEGKGSIFTVIIPVRPPPGGYSSESLVGGGRRGP
jgi:signal transduction histidine kinase